eukprot:TRINITY_DN6968_c0_g1_i1.p1 TRINITY_DN6968_c0_g1~~TRINITY_DN6968_c0_g1_i1.p1  ORF type:complete len:572 (+),score=146.83 TRINITY_DN6968_c0_g1_i1:78-1718(+)
MLQQAAGGAAVVTVGGGLAVLAWRCWGRETLEPVPELDFNLRHDSHSRGADEAAVRSLSERLNSVLDFVHREVRRIDTQQGLSLFSAGLVPTSAQPLVLVLGNHNAGKSTFVNSICGRDVQNTGAAPNDGFTMICRAQGGEDEDIKGPALVARRNRRGASGFEDLRAFGEGFTGHLELKMRRLDASATLPPGVLLVDTPGMIDAPGKGPQRPYDFLGVVRWFARRAALTLLFFDGSNPGTTGETLAVWREALSDYADRHKLMLILGKSDRFESVEDFARTYGALCWNLAKVSNEKDAPPIETLFNEVRGGRQRERAEEASLPVDEFVEGREKVMKAVASAVQVHCDSALTATDTALQRLTVATRVADRAAARRRFVTCAGWLCTAAATATPPLAALAFRQRRAAAARAEGHPEGWAVKALRWVSAAALSAGCCWGGLWEMRRRRLDAVSLRGLEEAFHSAYGRDAARVAVQQRWQHVRAPLAGLFTVDEEQATDSGLPAEPKADPQALSAADRRRLRELSEVVMPWLRSVADALKGHRRALGKSGS